MTRTESYLICSRSYSWQTLVMTRSPLKPEDFEHPLRRLAKSLNGGLEYPVPTSDRWLRVVLALAPCSVLVVVSIIWPPSSSFLLTFAGAFASIQLVGPYKKWSDFVSNHLKEAREQHRTALEWAAIKINFHSSPKLWIGLRPVGYSPLGELLARRRFPGLARRWKKSFFDMTGRMIDPSTSMPTPAAYPRWVYEKPEKFSYWIFVRRGNSVLFRLLRGLVGWIPLLLNRCLSSVADSELVWKHKRQRAERLLTRVSRELIRATAVRDGDRPVLLLAEQIGLNYSKPKIKPGWAASD